MDKRDITKAETQPITRIMISLPDKTYPVPINLTTFKRLAPNITGAERKNENSAAAVLDTPKSIAPRIVAPDLEVPGTSARHWKQPIRKAVR